MACPDPETLAAFVDGRLTSAERAAVAEHLSSCADCYELFAGTVRIQEAGAAVPAEVVPLARPSRAYRWLALAAALLVAALLGLWLVPTGHRGDVAGLVRATGNRPRTVEARLTGGFSYGPLRSPTRGPENDRGWETWQLQKAAADVKTKADANPTAQLEAALGVAHLLLGKPDEALTRLEEAARREPKAWLQSDLAAAYLARAREGHAEDLPKALAAAEKALALEPLPEAAFNRALALEALGRADEAKRAWEDYLKLDPRSPWAEEARQHLSR